MHYHAYTWTGDAAEYRRRHRYESHIDQTGFAASPIPPIKMCWWLRKPAHLIAGTWDMPWAAADWLADQYRAIADQIAAPTIWTEEMRPHATHDLEVGRDVTWHWNLVDGRRVFASAVVCCPNAWEPDTGCPLS